MQVALEKNVP